MWPPAHPLCRAKAGIGGMAWWEGGGDSWEGKEVRWWATDRLVRGPTVNLAAFRSLRPSTCWILADREGGGVAVEGKCGVRNPQTASWSTPSMVVSPANRPGGRGDWRGYSRAARRDVPPADVWCVPGWPVTTPPWYVTSWSLGLLSQLSGPRPARLNPFIRRIRAGVKPVRLVRLTLVQCAKSRS